MKFDDAQVCRQQSGDMKRNESGVSRSIHAGNVMAGQPVVAHVVMSFLKDR